MSSAAASIPKQKHVSVSFNFTLVHAAIAFVIIGCVTGGALIGKAIVEVSLLHAQISQIGRFDEAVSTFYDKFGGLPGDLTAEKAYRVGLAAGDGTSGHGDGDGKISPCNIGWQWNLGCETALFWGQLSTTGLISENFSADNRLTDSRLQSVGMMDPYLPKSPIADGIYIAVWNTDASQASPYPQLPYGNYYEISRISGIVHGRMTDDANALTPAEASAIDKKMDDGLPLNGRIVANGGADWPKDAWGTFAKPGRHNCVSPDKTYNEHFSSTPLCHVAIALACCKSKDEP
jgi:hypothetical protein